MDCSHIAEAAANVNVDVEKMRATLNNRSCNGEISMASSYLYYILVVQ